MFNWLSSARRLQTFVSRNPRSRRDRDARLPRLAVVVEDLESREMMSATTNTVGLGNYLSGTSTDTPNYPNSPTTLDDSQYLPPQSIYSSGTSTGQSATTLTDSSQNWATNAMQGMQIQIVVNSVLETATIASNTSTSLTLTGSGWTTAPTSNVAYTIYELAQPNVSANFDQVIQTNDWWSSMLWRYQGAEATNAIYPHPFVTQFNTTGSMAGLAVAYPNKVEYYSDAATNTVNYDYFMSGNGFDLTNFALNIKNIPFSDLGQIQVESYSDWGVTISYGISTGASTNRLYATMVQGSPYMYFTLDSTREVQFSVNNQAYGSNTQVEFTDNGDGTAYFGVPTGDHMVYYGLFAVNGSTWTIANAGGSIPTITSNGLGAASDKYFAMALLPPAFDPVNDPTDVPIIFNTFKAHAYAEISTDNGGMGTYVNYTYSPDTNQVVTLYGADVKLHATTFSDSTQLVNTPLMALYPHQWKASPSGTPLGSDFDYGAPNDFAKGLMKLYALDANVTNPWTGSTTSTGFTTTLTHKGGLLPFLPPVNLGVMDSNPVPGMLPDFTDPSSLNPLSQVQMIEYTAFVSPPTLNPQLDGYGTGKVLLKYANLVAIADQLANSPDVNPLDRPLVAQARDKLLNTLKLELARYMGASSFEGYQQFFQFLYYNQDWNTLIPYNAGYGAGQQINDHHFHYGYFLNAAAILAMYDPEFLKAVNGDDNFSGLLEMMARDVANWDRQDPSTVDTVFPFLRNFAPYAGHSYASGHGAFASGNNQEASSEAMNFWTGLALLGEAFMNAGIDSGLKMRDLGVSLYETEASNIEQYTFNIDGDIFPSGFVNPNLPGSPLVTMSAQNWDSGSHNALFFQSNYAEAPFSIDWLPITPGSLYLGRHALPVGGNSYVENNWEAYQANVNLLAANYPDFTYPVYPGTDWAYQSLFDPIGALMNYSTYWNAADIASRGNLGFDPGESAAMTLNWLLAMDQYGILDASVTATGVSTYAVFRNATTSVATYVAYNPSLNPVTVTFNDGGTMVPLTVPPKTMAYKTGTGSTALQPVGATAFGTSSGGNSSTTLNDSTQSWFAGQFNSLEVTITSGTGAGQSRIISGTSATALTISQAWSTIPDSTSTYSILKPGPSILPQPQQVVAAGTVASTTNSTLTDSNANWTPGQFVGMQVAITFSMTGSQVGQIGYITANTATTLTIQGTWQSGQNPSQGALYQISQPAPLGPQLYLSTGGLQNGVLTGSQPVDQLTTDTAVSIPIPSPSATTYGFGQVPPSNDPNTAHFEMTGVNMTLNNPTAAISAATSQFAIWLKDHDPSASGVDQVVAVAIRYKWNGTPTDDSDWDRVEMFQTSGSEQNYVGSNAPDTNVPSTYDLWNLYDSMRDPVAHTGYIQGNNPTWQSFTGGTIQVSVWMVTGQDERVTDVSVGSPEALGRQSFIALPAFYGTGLAFGSAPDSYSTSLANNGARHVATGATIADSAIVSYDADVGSATVDGADHGIFVAPLVPGDSSYFLANIQNATSGSTWIDAWIDYNDNGIFDHGERITPSGGQAVTTGYNKITFTVPSGAAAGQTYARFRVSSTGGLDPSGLASDGDIEDQVVWIDDTAPSVPKAVGIEGFYYILGNKATVSKAGNKLTFTYAFEQPYTATLDNSGTHFTMDTLPYSGDFFADSGFIAFSNGPVWQAVRQIAGSWILPAGSGGITQVGTDLQLTNAAKQTVAASFINAEQITVPEWGGIVGTLSREGTRIHFTNGKTWDMTPLLGNTFENASGAPVRIEQRGNELILVNRAGATSTARFLNSNEIEATGWGNIVGQIEDGNIYWSNGTEWRRSELSSSTRDIGGVWDVNGQNTRVLQSANALTFVNRAGGTSAGHFLSANEVVATDWGGIRGLLVGTQILWVGNGSVWSQTPDLNGARIDQAGRLTGIAQLERSLTFTNASGIVSHGTLIGTNKVIETDGARRQGLIAGNSLIWLTGGQVWNALPDLRGSWTVTTAGGGPAYIEQSGRTLLIVDPVGAIYQGSFTSDSTAVVSNLNDNSQQLIVTLIQEIEKVLALFSNGTMMKQADPSDLDTVFADPSMWPFT